MKQKKLYFIMIGVLILLVIWSIFFTVDYQHIQRLEDPVFSYKQSEISNFEYFTGLFYIIEKETHLDVTPSYWQEGQALPVEDEIVVYKIYPWFWPF